jgi:hypothetical protein
MNDYRLSYKIENEAGSRVKYDQSDDDSNAYRDLNVMLKKQLEDEREDCEIIKFERYCPYRDKWLQLDIIAQETNED